jgi:WD40 repeat protein
VAGSDDLQQLRVWRLSDEAPVVQPGALEEGFIWGASIAPSGTHAAFARVGGPAQIWDYSAGRLEATLPLVVNGNQGTLEYDSQSDLLLDYETWDPTMANPVKMQEGTLYHIGSTTAFRTFTYATSEQPDRAGALVFSPDASVLAGPGSSTQPGLLRFWSPTDGSLTGSIPAFAAGMSNIAWSPDGSIIAVAGADHIDTSQPIPQPKDESIRFWTVPGHALAATLTGFAGFVTSLAFLPSGKEVAVSDFTGAVQIRAVDGSSTRQMAAAGSQSGGIALSPKGDLLATVGVLWSGTVSTMTIRVQRTSDAAEVGRFYLHGDNNLGAASFTPDGTRLIAGSASALHVFCFDQIASPLADSDAGASR